MAGVQSLSQALAGIQNIEREIIAQARGRGGALDASQFAWNHGRSLAELPADLVHMEVRTKSGHLTADWSRTQLEDSWNRIDRLDVHQEIDRIVETVAPSRIVPSNKGFQIK